jgi:hypothetical protein
MRDRPKTGTCQSRKGLLFLRDCGEPAVAECQRCGRELCDAHRMFEEAELVCPECSAPGAHRGEAGENDPHWRDRYYNQYDYRPHYWSTYSYTSDDYGTFDRSRQPAAGTGTAQPEASDVSGPSDRHELDDPMES